MQLKTEPFLLLCSKRSSFREKLVSVIVSTFLFSCLRVSRDSVTRG